MRRDDFSDAATVVMPAATLNRIREESRFEDDWFSAETTKVDLSPLEAPSSDYMREHLQHSCRTRGLVNSDPAVEHRRTREMPAVLEESGS